MTSINKIVVILLYFVSLTVTFSLTGKTASAQSNSVDYDENSEIVKQFDVYSREVLLAAEQRDFQKAEQFQKNAQTLAERSGNAILKARSLHLAGRIYPQTSFYKEKILSSYYRSYEIFKNLPKSPQGRRFAGYLVNDLVFLFSDPEYTHTAEELKQTFELLKWINSAFNKYSSEENNELKIITFTNIGNAFYAAGHFPAQIIWLEKARSVADTFGWDNISTAVALRLLIGLHRGYRRIGNYEKSFAVLRFAEGLLQKRPNPYLTTDYLFELQEAYYIIGRTSNYLQINDRAIETAKAGYRLDELYLIKIYRLLEAEKITEAEIEFAKFQDIEKTSETANIARADKYVIRAIIAGYKNNPAESRKYFDEAKSVWKNSLSKDWKTELFILNWEATVALKTSSNADVLKITDDYLKAVERASQKDSLAWIYMVRAKAYFGLGNFNEARESVKKSVIFVEEKRKTESALLAVGVMEVLFDAYLLNLELELKSGDSEKSFAAADFLKSRRLKDTLNKNPENGLHPPDPETDPQFSKEIFKKSLEFLENPSNPLVETDLFTVEKSAIFGGQNNTESIERSESDLISRLKQTELPEKTKIVSFAFAAGGLQVFVYSKNKPIQHFAVDLSEKEAADTAENIQRKIRQKIFFRQDGKAVFDKLLGKADLTDTDNLIIIADHALWRIPFQALTDESGKYLIENYSVSYAPSADILITQINRAKPQRRNIKVFSNSEFDDKYLRFVEGEALSVARVYSTTPVLQATVGDFRTRSASADILHFSMHAEADRFEPFNSFLAFKGDSEFPSGKLTVNDLQNFNLKPGSLVYLSSCSTDNVFSGEGLVSLAWGMMNAGATTVVSTQWEANDESAAEFGKRFYKHYKAGQEASKALRSAAVEMINLKDEKFNKPYNWAEFTLNGDFR